MSNPSLILPQSPAYGEDYVYAAQVEDGAVPLYNVLPLTFTRASGGTRINKDGLVQNMPYNLLQQSNAFSTIAWAKTNTTLTSGQSDPNGGSNAWKVEFGSGNAYLGQFGIGQIGVVTISAYFRADSSTTIGFNDGSSFPNSITIGTTWQRYEFSYLVGGVQCNLQIDNYFGVSPSSQTKTFYIYGAQLNIGSTAQPYLATTDRLNMPRITYPVGGGCGALLLEKQSTNQILYSEQFDNAAWTKLNSTITANSVTSPDGTQDADTITDNTTNGVHVVYQIPSGQSIGTAWTCYMKKGSLNYGYISAVQSTTFFTTAIINLTNGSIVELQNGSSTTGTVTTENCGNGWYRVKMQTNANGAGYAVGTSNGSALSGTYKEAIYTGTGSGTIYIWGAQLEDSSYATSYIPTTSTSATRIADACYKTGISNLIGQTEGVVFVDWVQNALPNSQGIYANNYNLTGSISIQVSTNGTLTAFVCYAGTSFGISSSSNAIQIGQRYKLGFAYKSGDCALYLNGNLIGTNTTSFAFTTTLSEIDISNRQVFFADTTQILANQLVQYKTRLTNSELATLTTI